VTLKEAAEYAPLVTASVAALAIAVAVSSILVQKSVARRRAAIDFFLKTDMDEKVVKAFDDFNAAVVHLNGSNSVEEFAKTDKYIKSERI
jgi:hypothetical protein